MKYLILTPLVITVIMLGACAAPKEKQEIIEYLNVMMPIREAHVDWHEDQNRFAQTRHSDYNEAVAELGDLIRRMEKIYMDIETIIPPPALRGYHEKRSRICQLELQSLVIAIQALETGDTALLREMNELIFKANDLDTESLEELFDILRPYDIAVEDF